MKAVVLAAVLVIAAAAAGIWLVLQPPVPPQTAPVETAPVAADPADEDGDHVRRRVRAPRSATARRTATRERVDPFDAQLDAVRRTAQGGHPLDALERLLELRAAHPERFAEGAFDSLLVDLQIAVTDSVSDEIPALSREDALALIVRALESVSESAQRSRLRLLARRSAGDVAAREQLVVDGATNDADRNALTTHLAHFGPVLPGADRAAGSTGSLSARLQRVHQRGATRKHVIVPLTIADIDAAELRRLDQLEKLRERQAVGLLAHIHSGLIWLAEHQAEDGHFSDDVTAARCVELGHGTSCAENAAKRSYDLASTALAALAFLDFRDQDARAVFEPTLSAAVSWLRSQIRATGLFPRHAYEAGIALMALGQAASSSGDVELYADLERAWKYYAANEGQGASIGYRYGPGQPGDLSVTGWYVQAYEAAVDAEAKLPEGLGANLATFVRTTWRGGHEFAYTPSTGPRTSLESLGMLSIVILDEPAAELHQDAWAEHLAQADRGTRLNLYTLYYDVRMELALRGELSQSRGAALDDFAALYQTFDGNAAGRFTVEADPALLKAWMKQAESKRKPAVSGSDGWITRGGTTLLTAFSLLTLEHALYRR